MVRVVKDLFAGRHFSRDVIIRCVRWHLRYKLSFRDLVEMMDERGLRLSHTTIGVPGKFCTSGCEANWYGRGMEWGRRRNTVLSRS